MCVCMCVSLAGYIIRVIASLYEYINIIIIIYIFIKYIF